MANFKALKAISKLPICVGPFVQSTIGARVPFYSDHRFLFSHHRELAVVVEELAKVVKRLQKRGRIDLIVGVPMAGIPLAVTLALKTKIPFVYLNKERKKTLRQMWVEGDFKKGDRAMLVDDTCGTGGTILNGIEACREDGIIVKYVFVLNYAWPAKFRVAREKLKKLGITFHYLYTRDDWARHLYHIGKLLKPALEIQKAYLKNPTGWHKDKKIWQKFLDLKKRHKKTGKL